MDADRRAQATSQELGLDYQGNVVSRGLGKLVPIPIARRAIDVSVSTDRDVYDRDTEVPITVEFRNRLPVAVSVPTPTQRRWGWTIDGHLEGSEERRFVRQVPASFPFRAGQRRRFEVIWNGRIRRTGAIDESVVPPAGEYEITAYLAAHENRYRPSDQTTVSVR